MAQSTSASSSGLPSPTADAIDDNSNRLTVYLRQLAGNYEMDVDIIVKDHCYAKPWNWKPENNYAKPVKKLFFSKNVTKSKNRRDDEINVVDVDDKAPTLPFDLTKAQSSMGEFQRLVSNVRLEEDEDWEEKIDKTLWSPVQNRIFSKVTRILNAERLARLAKANSASEPIFRRMSIDNAARQFRETLASIVWDWRLAQWLHNLLFEHLSQEYLVIYLDVLQCLRQKIPQLIDKMIAVQPNIITRAGSITWETLGSHLKRSWDPVTSSLNGIKLKELPGNPILVVVPFGVTSAGITSSISARQQKWIAQLRLLGTVFAFHNYNHNHNHIGLAANRMTMMVCVDQLIQATRAKLQSIRSEYPGRPIVLVGFNTGAALACQVAQMEHVSAVVCIGFPFATVEGKRGMPDDTLMDLRCPVMFVIGQNATLVRPDDLEDLREKMMVETSLVVVGTADDYLRISTSKKMLEGITQSMVDRCILDEIGDFIGGIMLQPNPPPLRPTMPVSCDGKAKKEPPRRRNSTSSSVESEPNSPIVKRSRPSSPVPAAPSVGMNATTGSAPKIGAQALVQASGQHANHTPTVRRKRPANSQKNQLPEHLKTARVSGQTNIAAENGLTLNIGSLASLSPIGPICLAPSTASQTATTPSKAGSNVSRPSAASSKVPKIISNMPLHGKIKTIIPTGKSYSNVMSGNFRQMVDKNADTKLVNVITAGNQIRIGTASGAGSSKPAATTSGTLPCPLQSGKNPVPLTSTASAARASSTPSILLTTTSSPASSVTPSTVSKATEEAGVSCDSHVLDISKSAYVPRQEAAPNNTDSNTSCGNIVIVENSLHNRSAPSSVIVPLSGQSSGGVLPMSGKLRAPHKSMKVMPKITVNATNLQRLQKAKPQAIQKAIASDLDDDLGNILDIPIIFAKDDDSLSNIDKIPVVTQTALVKEPQERPKLNSATKVVLISNKQDKLQQQTPGKIGAPSTAPAVICPNMTVQNLNQLILQSQGNDVAARGRISVPLENRLMQPVKYTKIILAKRGTQLAQPSEQQQVLLTRNNTENASGPKLLTFKDDHGCAQSSKPSSSYDPLADDMLEIEDAIKTNIIERKYTPALTVEETSPLDGDDRDVMNKVTASEKERVEESTCDSASKVQT